MDYMELISTQCLLWLCYKFLFCVFSKGTKPYDFAQPNVIRKLVYKVRGYLC